MSSKTRSTWVTWAVCGCVVTLAALTLVASPGDTKAAREAKQRARLTLTEDAEPRFPAMTLPASWGEVVAVETNGRVGYGGGVTRWCCRIARASCE